jgi:ABC-type uncharacterized transport system permease subunit
VTFGGFRVERRVGVPGWAGFAVPFISTAVATGLAAVLLVASGQNPIAVFTRMFEISFVGTNSISSTLTAATPITLTGLAVAVAFRMKAWNIGGEGQLYVAAAAAAAVGIAFGNSGTGVAILAMIAVGAAAGALWILGPAVLRIRFHTTELIATLMLNYVAALLLLYLIFSSNSYVRDISPEALVYPQGKEIGESSFWPPLTMGGIVVPLGYLLGLVFTAIFYVVMRFTRLGFFIRVIGASPTTGRYAGMRTSRIFLVVMLLSGALSGLAGASQIGDFSHHLEPRGLPAAQYAWTGVVVALVASLNPLGVIASGFAIGGLRNAAFELQGSEFPNGFVGIMQGLILFSIAMGLALVHLRITRKPVDARETDRAAFGEPVGSEPVGAEPFGSMKGTEP